MAEIDVVPKNRSNSWLWIVAAVIIVALLIWAFTGRPHRAARLNTGPSVIAAFAPPPPTDFTTS